MEIINLLKANIRYKKGAFISIALLMVIISMSLTAILSVSDNCKNSIENAMEQVNAGDLSIFIQNENLTEELLSSVKNHKMVKKVTDDSTVCSIKSEINGESDENGWFMQKLRPEYRVLNQEMTAYQEETLPLKKGEIYIPQGVCTNMKCKVGDTVKISTIGGSYKFKIKGIIVEPVNGSQTIGWKQVFISDKDFNQLYADGKKNETDEMSADIHILQLYKGENCTLSDAQFKRQLNLDTGIVDNGKGSLTKYMSIYYTNLFPQIISSILMVFIGFLMFIVLIIIGHSISTSIEMDYVNLGVMKSQGFTKAKIRFIFVLQYLFAQITGSIFGTLLAIPLVKELGNIFQPITAILIQHHISIGKSLFILFAVIVVSVLFVIFSTRKIGRISPVKAISGGREEIYFDSRIKAPISKKALSLSLAFRQFTSNKRHYIGIILIVSILVFFIMTIMVLGNVLNSKSAIESMGVIYTELDITFREEMTDEKIKEIENLIEGYSKIEKKYYLNTKYISINGEELYCLIFKNPEAIQGILKGRAVIYENEIVITNILANELNLKIGDKVILSNEDQKEEYLIVGLNQNMNDLGLSFAMSLDGAKKIGVENTWYADYSLSDSSKASQIAKALDKKYGDMLEVKGSSDGATADGTYEMAVNAMKAVIYTFSIIFALVVVHMVCSKNFLREKKDIGIYKSQGFHSGNLRMQFAIRFLIIAMLGAGLGSILSVLFSGKILSYLLRHIGITSFAVEFNIITFIAPITLVCVCFFAFAYLVSRKIKKLEVKVLVIE